MQQVNKPFSDNGKETESSRVSARKVMLLEAAGWAQAAQAHENTLIPFIKKQQVFANAANPEFPERVNFEPSEPKHVPLPAAY